MNSQPYDFDKLTDEQKDLVTDRIRIENREKSETYYPLPKSAKNLYSKYGKRIIDIILSNLKKKEKVLKQL